MNVSEIKIRNRSSIKYCLERGSISSFFNRNRFTSDLIDKITQSSNLAFQIAMINFRIQLSDSEEDPTLVEFSFIIQ